MKPVTSTGFLLALLILVPCLESRAQDSLGTETGISRWQISGYISDMQVVGFQNLDTMNATNLIHNRLDIRFDPSASLSFHAGIRNRIFFGNPVSGLPGLGNQINARYPGELFNLSKFWVNRRSLIILSVIDRLWGEWNRGRWDIRIGRQRINWGKALVWNPTDWFNTYNFTDFDYPERPGSDALRLQYFPTGMSDLELALSPAGNGGSGVSALRYGFNRWNYDIQVLGGLYHRDLALGLGWSGNIGNAGFRGEGSWFHPYRNFGDSASRISVTLSLDYRAPDTWYIQGAVLFNTLESQPANLRDLLLQFTGNLSAQQLMPAEWSLFGELSRDINPLWHADLSAILGQKPSLLFLMPSLRYSLTENLECSLTGQVFFGHEQASHLSDVGNGVYLRFKLNF